MPKDIEGFPVMESIDTSGFSMNRNVFIFSKIFLTGNDSLNDLSNEFIKRPIMEFKLFTPIRSAKKTKDFLCCFMKSSITTFFSNDVLPKLRGA